MLQSYDLSSCYPQIKNCENKIIIIRHNARSIAANKRLLLLF